MDFKPVFRFLSSLKRNNNKEWFEEHRNEWDQIRKEFALFIDDLLVQMTVFDASIAGLNARDCTFRINRDVRFSKNKSPYKSNIGAWMACGGKKSEMAGYYLHLEPGNSFVAGGVYMPSPEVLKSVRQEIDYNADQFLKLIQDKPYKKAFGELTGEALSRIPKGFSPDAAIEQYIKLKSFVSVRHFSDAEVSTPSFTKEIIKLYMLMKPFNDFINEAIRGQNYE